MDDERARRAGRYVRQATGYAAFIPAPLPPRPPIVFDDELVTLLSRADQAVGRLDALAEDIPEPTLFVSLSVRKEAVLSSRIEGTRASLFDVLAYEANAPTPGSPADVQEVVNYVAAMTYGLERLATLPLSLRLIREIHERLMTGVRGSEKTPGEFRRSQNWIGPPGSTLATAALVPPPPHEMHAALDNLEKFLHDRSPMPVLIKVGLAHAQFETIHPFQDGNGRVGRLLITLLLCHDATLRLPLLHLSSYFARHQSEYYDRLQAIHDREDWEGWLTFFLRGVADVAQEATVTGREIKRLQESHRRLIAERLGRRATSALQVLDQLSAQPIVTVDGVAAMAQLSYKNANTLVRQLCDLGILRELTGQRRNRRFSYAPYLALFTDEAPADATAPRR